MTPPVFEVRWTVQVLRMLRRIADRRIQRLLVETGKSLAHDPERKGKPLWGPLKGYRSIRAAGQRYRLLYRIEQGRVVVWVVAAGIRKEGDGTDVYALARRLLRHGLL